jgi:RNA polymerase sigma-70 factor, ECF subfamily
MVLVNERRLSAAAELCTAAMNIILRASASIPAIILRRKHLRFSFLAALSMPSATNISHLLAAWSDGDESALDELVPAVEAELRRLAAHYMRGERAGHTLETTALINEVYLRFVGGPRVRWQSRAHFYGIAAKVMREILIDYARARRRRKRGGDRTQVSLDEGAVLSVEKSAELLALHEALNKLSDVDRRKSRVVELRYFGGLSVEEIAEVLKVSPVTVMRDWSIARAWLRKEIGGER